MSNKQLTTDSKKPLISQYASRTPLLVEWLLIGVASPLLFLSAPWMICGIFLIITAWIVRRRAYGCWRLATLADPALALLLLTALIGLMVSVESSVSLYRAMILSDSNRICGCK